jgi:hypothetical protein
MPKRTILIFVIILLVIIVVIFFRTGSQIENFDPSVTTTAEIYYHVKSYRVFQPLKKGSQSQSHVYLSLDSPKIAYDTIPVSADVLNAALQVLHTKYCLYNLNSQNLIGSSDPLK